MAAKDKHRAFAEFIAQGMNHADAYRAAGYKAKNTASASTMAGRLLKNVEVQALIKQAVEKASTKRVLTAQERRERLTELTSDPNEPKDVIAAIRELNAMDGLHIKKLEHSGPNGQPIGATLATIPDDVIRERIAELAKRKAGK
jgi:phage terminase small subunit